MNAIFCIYSLPVVKHWGQCNLLQTLREFQLVEFKTPANCENKLVKRKKKVEWK